MFLGVVVDIDHQVEQVSVRFDGNSPEGVFEQAACAAIGIIEGLGIAVEEGTQDVSGFLILQFGWDFRQAFDTEQNVKMIAHLAVGEGVGDWGDYFCIPGQKEMVIPLFSEDVLAIVAAVVDVVIGIVGDGGVVWHGLIDFGYARSQE